MDEKHQKSKSKSNSDSDKMSIQQAAKLLNVGKTFTFEELDAAYKAKTAEVQTKFADKPEKLVQEADNLYSAYRRLYLSKPGADENKMLPLTIEGPESMLNAFGIQDLQHANVQVQMQSQAHYKDGQLVKKESNRTEAFVNKDGKREVKVYENGKLIKHTIDNKDMLRK